MPWRRFLIANAAGGIAWAAIYTAAAYLAGDTLSRISGPLNMVLLVLAVIGIVTALVAVRRKMKQLADVAEEAYPGPLR